MTATCHRVLAATMGLVAAAAVAAPAEVRAENVLDAISSQSKVIRFGISSGGL